MIALYHSIRLCEIREIISLARSVRSSTHDRGRYIRHLRFCFGEYHNSAGEMAAWMEASHGVLLSATQLESFWNEAYPYALLFDDNFPSFGSHLATVRAAAPSTLRSLHLILANGQARDVLLNLKPFDRLETLDILLEEEGAISSDSMIGVSPGTWNEVKDVKFRLEGRRSYDALQRYLLACRFPRVQTIVLSIPVISDNFEDGLVSFLDAHGATCETLSFISRTTLADSSQFCQRLGSVLLRTADHLRVKPAAPVRDILECWAPDAKIAKLTLDISAGLSYQGQLWNVLQKASQKDFRPRGLRLDIMCGFLWGSGANSPEEAEFVCKLISFALDLVPRGVSIADESGCVLVP
jgi:hypothetical protein